MARVTEAPRLPFRERATPGFELLPPALTGLSFTNRLFGEMFLTNAVAHNGAGVAASDVDGDVTVEQLEAVRVGGR